MVRLPEDKPSLTHQSLAGAHYDPFKAHEYYIRTRKLHPRQKGSGRTVVNRGRTRLRPATPNLQKQRAEAAAQVDSLQKKLSQLNQALKVALAKEAKPKKPKYLGGGGKPSAADKAKAARLNKKYRQKHKQQLKTKAKQASAKSGGGSGGSSSGKGTATTKKSGSGSSTAIRAAITRVQQALAAAKARQRALG